jgi:ornithine cyclodeaminase/alanine dehydrogenase-like protein (mu-crystallin family)
MLFDISNGVLLAIVDATELTGIRTAAAAAATDALARPGPPVVAILGSGSQAASHVDAMCAVRPVEEVRIWSRDRKNADRPVAVKQDSASRVRAMATVAEAVPGKAVCIMSSGNIEASKLASILNGQPTSPA